VAGQATCYLCPDGEIQALTGQTSCGVSSCSSGDAPNDARSACVTCLAGQYATAGAFLRTRRVHCCLFSLPYSRVKNLTSSSNTPPSALFFCFNVSGVRGVPAGQSPGRLWRNLVRCVHWRKLSGLNWGNVLRRVPSGVLLRGRGRRGVFIRRVPCWPVLGFQRGILYTLRCRDIHRILGHVLLLRLRARHLFCEPWHQCALHRVPRGPVPVQLWRHRLR